MSMLAATTSSSRSTIVRSLALVIVLAVAATACSRDDGTTNRSADGEASQPTTDQENGSTTNGDESSAAGNGAITVRASSSAPSGGNDTSISIELRAGDSGETAGSAERERTVEGAPLDAAESDRLLNRLPPLVENNADRVDFFTPPPTRPRPTPGTRISGEFPPSSDQPGQVSVEAEPLEVVRFQPEGAVDLAPFISVTFNQPMVAIGTVDAVEQEPVPIDVTPEMPGRWIWLGTRTARFEYEPGAIDRIPAATNYMVRVPAGTESATGATLTDELVFEFTTPTPTVTRVAPMNDSLSTSPIFFIEFDQRVAAQQILDVVELDVAGEPVPVRLASDERITADPRIAGLAEGALPERWLAIVPERELATDAPVRLRIGPNIPSAEGPETNPDIARFEGRTHGPLRLEATECGWDGDCRPGMPIRLRFSNPLEATQFSAAQIRITPELRGARIGASGNTITIEGLTSGQTDYEITVDASLADTFDQTLGTDAITNVRVGDAQPAIFNPGRQLITLDPVVADNVFTLTTINNPELQVRVYEVDPARDWDLYLENNWRIARDEFTPPWTVVRDSTIASGVDRNRFGATGIDLTDELEATGHVVVVVSPTERVDDDWQNQPVVVWVQRTTIGIDAYTDSQRAIVRVTDLATGEPLQGIDVTLVGRSVGASPAGTTDRDGLSSIELGADQRSILATDGEEIALLGEFWASRWTPDDQLRWFVLNDRGVYKPGETVSIKGWIRQADADEPAALSLPRSGATVTWSAQDAFGNQIGAGEAPLSPVGGFDLELELPDDITLGFAGVQFSTDGFPNTNNATGWHQFQVQEFRRPDFEVATSFGSPEPRFAGDQISVAATATYFAGGPLPGSPIDWQVTARAASYRPPAWPDFSFGVWTPWWREPFFGGGFADDFGGPFEGGFAGGTSEFFSATTDASGRHDLEATIAIDGTPAPVSVSATATVVDVNRQPISGSTTTLVHPAAVYVGMRADRTFSDVGDALTFELIATDLDGGLVTGRPIEVRSTRLEWRFEAGSWVEMPVVEETCSVTSAESPVACEFSPSRGGRYRITATVTDAEGRTNLSELTRWVSGGEQPQSRRVELETLTVVPSGDSWKAGDVAEILVQSPFNDAHGLAVISRVGIDRMVTFDFDENGTAVLEVPIADGDIPGIGVQIEAVGSAPRTGLADASPVPARPAYAAGQLTLPVSTDDRRLAVEVAPRAERLEPGSGTTIDVAVTGPTGDPVEGAELAVLVVDEAVLSLTNHQYGDPIDAFYPASASQAQPWRGRSTLILADPSAGNLTGDEAAKNSGGDDALEEAAMDGDMEAMADEATFAADAPMAPTSATERSAGQAGGGLEQPPIEVRTNFDALAVFEPEVTTDSDGRASIEVDLPDSLTRYRVVVVATADATDAGTGDSNITAQLPITVRPTPPRFANFGDSFEFPVVVQNAHDAELEIDVALRATNLTITDRNAATITVPPNDRVEVRFAVTAEETGTVRYQVVASSGDFTDAAAGTLPVYTPATAEAFATYGVLDSGAIAQPLAAPVEVVPQFGGLEITTSSTAVSALADAVVYLADYRYDHSDAFASRIIAIVSLGDVLDAFRSSELPPSDELRGVMQRDVTRLTAMQNGDGGFPHWQRGRESIPYNSVQATHALVLARSEGIEVPEQTLTDALWYLTNIDDHFPNWYSEKTKVALEAYALHVRFLAGDRDTQTAQRVFDRRGDDQVDVAAWLWPLLADTPADAEIERLLANRLTETPNAATFATSYGEQTWVVLHSDRRTDAIVLDALVRMRPDSDLVVKVLNGILAARNARGQWTNVQENSFVLLAGAAYFAEFEDTPPDFIAQAWIGDTYAVEHEYSGFGTAQNATLVPMSVLANGTESGDIVVAKDGDAGRLYYRLGLRYAPQDLTLAPRDQGFVVARTYEPIDDPGDVVLGDDGTWTVRAGARVRVRLSMVADSRRTHVALIDPMPAGFESINPTFSTSEPVPFAEPSDDTRSRLWWYRWFDHQNLRDDRAEAFSTWLNAGSYEYTYVARATTVGQFVVPPPRAEQIYEPEVFGRGSSTNVTVTD